MSALAIVSICLGAFGYCGLAVYVYLRLLWYFKQRGGYAVEIPAAMAAAFLPIGLCVLAVHMRTDVAGSGLAPRSVRRKETVKRQREEIARLERELEIGR